MSRTALSTKEFDQLIAGRPSREERHRVHARNWEVKNWPKVLAGQRARRAAKRSAK